MTRPVAPGRRALLTAAWSVPAITLVSAAPAYAASPGGAPVPAPTQLSVVEPTATLTADPTTPSLRIFTGAIRIDNPTDTATTGLQVTFTMPLGYVPIGTPVVTLNQNNGSWVLTGGGVPSGSSNVTAVLTARDQLAPRSSTLLEFRVRASMPNLPSPPPPLEVRPMATNLTLGPWVPFTPQ